GLLGIITRHDVGADTFQAGQHRHRWSVQNHRLSTALAVRKEQQATLKIDVLPPQMQDFPQSASGEEQEAKGRRRERADLGFPIFCLWKMLCRGLCFVNVPRNAFRLGLPDRGAQLFQLCASQEPLAAVLCKLVDLTSRICALRYGTDPSPEGIYTADHCEHAI